jgi:hypothetical protein
MISNVRACGHWRKRGGVEDVPTARCTGSGTTFTSIRSSDPATNRGATDQPVIASPRTWRSGEPC